MITLHNWQNFYMLTGTAAATLIGLLFVAVSITVGTHISGKRASNLLHTFVSPTLIYYAQVLLISCLAVMPLLNLFAFQVALAVLGCLNIFLALKVCWRILVVHKDEQIDLEHWVWDTVLPFVAGILLLGSAISFSQSGQLAPLGLSIADLLCLAIGLHNTWVLMLWLILHQGGGNVQHAENDRGAIHGPLPQSEAHLDVPVD